MGRILKKCKNSVIIIFQKISQIIGYIDDIFHMCKLVPRVAFHLVAVARSEANYFDVVAAHRELRSMKGICLLSKKHLLARFPSYSIGIFHMESYFCLVLQTCCCHVWRTWWARLTSTRSPSSSTPTSGPTPGPSTCITSLHMDVSWLKKNWKPWFDYFLYWYTQWNVLNLKLARFIPK